MIQLVFTFFAKQWEVSEMLCGQGLIFLTGELF